MIRSRSVENDYILPENSYFLRYLFYALKGSITESPNIMDYKLFPHKVINNSDKIFNFKSNIQNNIISDVEYKEKSVKKTVNLNHFLSFSHSSAFLIIKDDEIIVEKYLDSFQRDSLFRAFSITKSFSSALIGIAMDENHIKSINDSIIEYIPELEKKGFKEFSLKNLLQMDSGIIFTEGRFPWNDQPKVYFDPDSRKLSLNLRVVDEIGKYFHYNDYHLLLLGIILERSTKKSLTEYFSEKIWKPLEMEFPATISIDSTKTTFEKLESGLNARAIDLAKLGRLFLNNGNWNGKQIISESWIRESTGLMNSITAFDHYRYYEHKSWGRWFKTGNGYYKYLWWGYKIDESTYDFFAMGILGQFIYISPRKNTIIVRLGKKWGIKDWWPTILKELVDRL